MSGKILAYVGAENAVMVARIVGALIVGALIGLERSFHARPAGFRTHALVCVASALLMLVTVYQNEWMTQVAMEAIRTDPTRMAQGIMTGIGFLGAGAIIKQQSGIRGLTTAAGLWCVAAIGMAVGLGLYVLSGAAALMVVAALWLLDYLDHVLPTRHFRRLTVRCHWDRRNMDELTKRLQSRGLRVEQFNYQRLQSGGDVAELDITVSFLGIARYRAVEAELHDDPAYTLVASARV